MSLNHSMNISVNSMKNNQYALTVVSQNIANMHVEGYHKQRVEFATNEYTTNCENVLSTIKGMNGASISALTNYADEAQFKDMLGANSDAEYYNTLADSLKGLEDIADDLGDNGINGLLNEFYTAAANLEQNPSDMAIRQQYVLAAQNVCDKFNTVAKKYDDLENSTLDSLGADTAKINSLFKELAQANAAHLDTGRSSSTKSQIDSILSELSNYVDFKQDTNPNGTVNVYIGDTAVVRGAEQKFTLEQTRDANNKINFNLKSTEDENAIISNVSNILKGGSLKAKVDFLNGSDKGYSNISDMKTALNTAASAFANALNEIQNYDQGDVFAASITTDPDGNLILEKATEPFFKTSDGAADFSALNIQVNPDVMKNPYLVSAARIDLNKFDGQDWKKAIGNSDNATEITALQNKKICSYNGGTNNCTLSQFLVNNAAKNGADAASIGKKADIYNDIYDTDATNYANTIGVNLDEELADMIRYQRAFEASARVFSTANDLMGTIINMV